MRFVRLPLLSCLLVVPGRLAGVLLSLLALSGLAPERAVQPLVPFGVGTGRSETGSEEFSAELLGFVAFGVGDEKHDVLP